jgi:gluconate 5-dehydrogenase
LKHTVQPPDFALSGKVAVVTGASRGIGAALAGALAGAGATLALLGRDEAALDAAVETLQGAGCSARSFVLDVADTARIEPTFDRILESLGGLHALVNNAGVDESCAALDVSEALWDRIVGTNLKAAFFCAQAAARRMMPGSSIVNVCSLTSEVGIAGAAPYGASKSGLAGLTRALAIEWAERGIRVNGIGPGYFRTALTESFYRDPGWQAAMHRKVPLQRFGALEDLGGAVVFLCSGAASYITGQVLYVDGGLTAAL